MPSPKKVSTRWRVRSKNWSGITKSSGLCSSFNDPTADTETNPFDSELFEAVNVGAKIQFRGKNAVSTSVARQECNLAAFERAQNIGVRRVAEWSLLLHFPHVGEAGHGIKPTAADDADFRLRQKILPERSVDDGEFVIIQK